CQRDHNPSSRPRSRLIAPSIAPRAWRRRAAVSFSIALINRSTWKLEIPVGSRYRYCEAIQPAKEQSVMAKSSKPATAKKKLAAAPSAPGIDIGIKDADRKKVADGLSHFLADAY